MSERVSQNVAVSSVAISDPGSTLCQLSSVYLDVFFLKLSTNMWWGFFVLFCFFAGLPEMAGPALFPGTVNVN